MRIKRYYEFKEQLIQEAEEDDFGLGVEDTNTEDTPDEDTNTEDTPDEDIDTEEEKPLNDNPESYLKGSIKKLQKKIEALFNDEENSEEISNNSLNNIGPEVLDRSQRKKKSNKESMTLKDMGTKLESSDVAKSSKTHKSLVIKFSDDAYYYSLYVKVTLKEALDLIEAGEELTDESIQKAYVKMKKIDLDTFEEVGTINRNVMMADIDEDFIIELKLELDEESTGEEEGEDFSIET